MVLIMTTMPSSGSEHNRRPAEVWRLPIDGSASTQLDVKLDAGLGGALAVAPDGRSILFFRALNLGEPGETGDMWHVPLYGGQPTRFDMRVTIARLHPDGLHIALVVYDAGNPKPTQIWVRENLMKPAGGK
jgi:hypothetical protein